MNQKAKKVYNPQTLEKEIQKFWRENDFFNDKKAKKPFFSIVLPPPNITGDLHLGHAWDSYYPDLLIRYKKLLGFSVKWFPGLDHAGIATQAKVEQWLLKDSGQKREDLGYEEFIKIILTWKEANQKQILQQWDKLGLILNYEDLKFTLDQEVNKIVNQALISYYNDDFLYRDQKIINWDPKLKTVISNIEVIKKETISILYNINYQIKDSNDFVTVSTTRPETIFGDSALFVNPNDRRYFKLHNKFAVNPLTKAIIPILLDEYVDIDFGSGVMKATPAHDFNDYELAKKHNLKIINIYDQELKLNQIAGEFQGLSREEARIAVLKYFQSLNLLLDNHEIKNLLPYSQRSDSLIEPILSWQWFLRVSKFRKKLLELQEQPKSKINFFPVRFEQEYLNWLENLEDWCISRQLWWGHRLPIWFDEKGNHKVQIKKPGKNWTQTQDVLDTWFSSSLWPIVFSEKKYVKNSLNSNALSDTLFTGYDIIYFWVTRMIIQAWYLKNTIPFKNVILHGLMRDSDNKKMSKSLNNGINPIAVIDKWGSDALRMFLLGNSTPGNDLRYNEEKINYYWDINNKLFNINQLFKHWKTTGSFKNLRTKLRSFTFIDHYLLNKINIFLKSINENVEKYNLTIIYSELIELILNDFAGFYLELVKKLDDQQKQNALLIFIKLLIILHPFIPFITEDIYQQWKEQLELKDSILLENYPQELPTISDNNQQLLFDAVKTHRIIRLENNYHSDFDIKLYVSNSDNFQIDLLNFYLQKFNMQFKTDINLVFNGVNVTLNSGAIYYYFVDRNLQNKTTLNKKVLEKFNFEYTRANKLINNAQFVKKASPELLAKEQQKVKFYQELIKILKNEDSI